MAWRCETLTRLPKLRVRYFQDSEYVAFTLLVSISSSAVSLLAN